MLDEGEPRTIGYVAHRTIVPMADVTADVDRDDVVLWSGPGFHIVHYPLRHGTLFNIVAVFKTSDAALPSAATCAAIAPSSTTSIATRIRP